ncbi:hypothetical protein EZS27_031063 [termite gut metagenome]|uniref:Transposase IS200-like domain-containing protein n=1 Tax=termite gut metagenome TaxID=433724 RepID=A0A5J4QB85_9ZZZZ
MDEYVRIHEHWRNDHVRRSIRLKGYDYSQAGLYFVTMCCQGKEHYFGEIANGKMILSQVGIIADVLWCETRNHANRVESGEFVVMPNHIHCIVMLNDMSKIMTETVNTIPIGTADIVGVTDVGARHALPLQQQLQLQPSSRFQNQGTNTLSSIIGSYKSAVSKHAHRLGFAFTWQRNYYEHIIRNEQSHQNIYEYIINNPANWKDDTFYYEY